MNENFQKSIDNDHDHHRFQNESGFVIRFDRFISSIFVYLHKSFNDNNNNNNDKGKKDYSKADWKKNFKQLINQLINDDDDYY